MVWPPIARVAVWHMAALPFCCGDNRTPVQPGMGILLSVKFTGPVGLPPKAPVTAAVKVTSCPKLDGLGGTAVRTVAVSALFTSCENRGDALPVKFASPL